MNAYEILNIAPTASRDEIRANYRNLARRWHPDRFMEGPERDWANEKMAEINAAYRACLDGTAAPMAANEEKERLAHIQQLIDDGNYLSARKLLGGFSTRCAEWNYLFGAVLLKTSDVQKALIYLGVAARQQPDNLKYVRALKEAQSAVQPAAKRGFASLLRRRV